MSELVVDSGASRERSMLAPAEADYAQLRRLNIFDGIPNADLSAAIASGGIRRAVYERDHLIADPLTGFNGLAPVLFVAEGQVAAGVFDGAELAERRALQERIATMSAKQREELSLLRPPALARVAKKNVAAFLPGDLFNSAAVSAADGFPTAFFTTAPTELAAIAPSTLAEFAVRFPFFEARFRRAITISRQRLHDITGVKQEILDFFVRHGISVAGPIVRVRQLDRCIDCKQCEEACEERYGSRRLTLGGYQLGMLDFVFTCRTCVDQRCVDPCEYDSIRYDPELEQVVINEASCTGCTLCAQSCPYHAIEMVDVEDPQHPTYREDFKLRLEADGSLAFGAGKPRIARPRRVANKCDHCASYRDQACVSACPTGALIEIDAGELFRERSQAQMAVAKSGYDQEVSLRDVEVLPTEPFTRGVGVRDAGLAKTRRGRVGPVVMWGIGLAAWMLALLEIALRLYVPKSSLQYLMLRHDPRFAGMPMAALVERIDYRAGMELAVWCGYFGTGLMAIAAIYPMFRRMRAFRWLASNTMWFDFHMMAGTVGPLFILLHSALKLDNWVSAAFWSMVIVVVSGVIGRYLYTQVPDLLNGRELEELEIQRAFARLRADHPAAAAEAEAELKAHRANAQQVADSSGIMGALMWIILQDLKRPVRWLRRRARIGGTSAPRRVRRELVGRLGRAMLIERRRVLVPRAQLLLHSWKKVHVPFTVIMVLISAVHIWVAFQYSM